MSRTEEPPPWMSAEHTGCPVGLAQQAWIETSMQWFVGQFGRDAALGKVVLPASGFIPTPYSATLEQIFGMVTKAYEMMAVKVSGLDVVFTDPADRGAAARKSGEKRAVGHYYVRNGRPVIGLDTGEASDPAYLTAIIAHELCHVRLLGEGRITATRKDHERLTDLLTVYLGFGVFTSNAALSFGTTARGWSAQPVGYLDERTLNAAHNDGYSRLGYLTEQEFGYAMACHCWLRRETNPPWISHLDPGPRTFLKQGLTYLSRNAKAGDYPTLNMWDGRISIRLVARSMRPGLGLYLPFSAPRREDHRG
jgi:hypothetical protein